MELYENGKLITLSDGRMDLLPANLPLGLGNYIMYTVMDDEDLESIANKFYDDSTRWFIIANANNIEKGWLLETGTVINIPKL